MDIFRAEFGKRLREARIKAGLKQHHIAEAADVEQTAVSNWETGKDFPDDLRLPAICKLLDVDEEYFTKPQVIIRTDPLPEWAEAMERRMGRILAKHEERLKTDIEYRSLNNIAKARQEQIQRLEKTINGVPPAIWQGWKGLGRVGRAVCLYLVGDEEALESLRPSSRNKILLLLNAIRRDPQPPPPK